MNLRKITMVAAGLLMTGAVLVGCKGEDGDAGADGNANVNSTTYLVTMNDWSLNSAGSGAEVLRQNPSITADVASRGVVQSFFSSDTTAAKEWLPMPTGAFSYAYRTDTVTFTINGFTGAGFDIWYKVITIPASAKVDGLDENATFEELEMVYGKLD